MKEFIQQAFRDSISIKQTILSDAAFLKRIDEASQLLIEVFRRDGKALFCGNGGSAADAQHLAAELSGRFYINRPPLYAEALHVNGSYLTAVANDYSFNEIYARMVEAAGRAGDVLIALSTSGNSPNVLRALESARTQGMKVIGLTGESGGQMRGSCDILFNVPSNDTPRIQEAHILIGHVLCASVERALFGA